MQDWPRICGWHAMQEISALEMHGTGTALGDPIEMGAACAVLQGAQDCLGSTTSCLLLAVICCGVEGCISDRSLTPCRECAGPHPVRYTAAKSHVGHTEPVAGLIGLCNAANMLSQHSSHNVMHLRQVSSCKHCPTCKQPNVRQVST